MTSRLFYSRAEYENLLKILKNRFYGSRRYYLGDDKDLGPHEPYLMTAKMGLVVISLNWSLRARKKLNDNSL